MINDNNNRYSSVSCSVCGKRVIGNLLLFEGLIKCPKCKRWLKIKVDKYMVDIEAV